MSTDSIATTILMEPTISSTGTSPLPGIDKQRIRIVIIGPVPPTSPTSANPIGGAALNFAEMLSNLRRRNFLLGVIDINRPLVRLPGWRVAVNNICTFISLIRSLWTQIGTSKLVFLNGNPGTNFLFVGTCIWSICRLRKRPMVLRVFGGNFADTYESYPASLRLLANHTIMRCAAVFVQTRAIHRRFCRRANFHWFPNTRNVLPSARSHSSIAKRFVFVSRLYMAKGLREAVDACRDLPEDYHLDVYGPIMADTDLSLFRGNDRATYRGVLSSSELPATLSSYDLLLFPSYWDAEGHPGIVIEALQCGVPVVATHWRGIPEIIEHGRSGLLVAPRSTEAVRKAIDQIRCDSSLYRVLRSGARLRGELFRSGRWYNKMASQLRGLSDDGCSAPSD